MRKIYSLAFASLAAASAIAAPLTPGNLLVVQLGADNNASAPNSAGTRVILKEYTPAGTLVQSFPINYTGAATKLVNSGTATSEGFLSALNGNYAFAGYDAEEGTGAVASTNVATNARVVGFVNNAGTVNLSTVLTDAYDAGNFRSAVTDGTTVWTAGTSGVFTTGGVRSAAVGASTSTQLDDIPTNIRVVGVYNGQLYVCSSTIVAGTDVYKGVSSVGTGLPTTSGQQITVLPGFPDSTFGGTATGTNPPYDFVFDGTSRLYLADERTTASGGGVRRYSLVAGTWVLDYVMNTGLPNGVRAITLKKDALNNNVLYVTSAATAPQIFTATDTGAASAFSQIVTSDSAVQTNSRMRGIRVITASGSSSTTVSGTLNLNGFAGPLVPGNFTVEVRNGGTVVDTKTVSVSTSGAYSFTTTASGTRSIYFKGRLWLGKLVGGVSLSGSPVTVNATLINGDCNNDKACDFFDYLILNAGYEANQGESAYDTNPGGDLTGDTAIDFFDYLILNDNFEKEGDF